MKCSNCGGKTTVTHTEQTTLTGIKRNRVCHACGTKVTTYERANTPNQHEERLVASYRTYNIKQRRSLWGFVRLLRDMTGGEK